MTRLLTTTAIGLIVAFSTQVQAQTTQTAEVGGPCQQQWTAIDENSDGKITQSEAEAAAEAEFSRIDMDENGTISVKEWKDCAAPGAIPGGFARTDTGSQTVERAIGESGTSATGESGEQAMAEADSQDQTGETTAAADSQGEGADATADVTGVAEAWGGEFSDMDTDDSGDISAEEAAQWSRSQTGAEQQADEDKVRAQAARFANLDSDGDGKVSEQEWQQRGQADVEARFGRIDKDGDGDVTKSEWQEHRQGRFEQAQGQAHESVDLWLFYYNLI